MKKTIAIISLLVVGMAFGVTVRQKSLPPSPWLDTEISKNVPFAGHEVHGN